MSEKGDSTLRDALYVYLKEDLEVPEEYHDQIIERAVERNIISEEELDERHLDDSGFVDTIAKQDFDSIIKLIAKVAEEILDEEREPGDD